MAAAWERGERPLRASKVMKQRPILPQAVLAILLWAGLSAGPLAAHEALPVDIQIGFERNEVGLIDVRGGTSRSAKEPDFSTAPVLKIMSPIKLGCVALRRSFNQGTSSQREGCIGFGGRFSGAQRGCPSDR